jgi:hypothetical protein
MRALTIEQYMRLLTRLFLTGSLASPLPQPPLGGDETGEGMQATRREC